MAKSSAMMKMVDKLVALEEQRIRTHSRIFTLDMVTIALGRLGWGEKRLSEFDKMLTEVSEEFSFEIISDSRDDVSLDYSKSLLDRELKQYTGDMFVPYEERYAGVR